MAIVAVVGGEVIDPERGLIAVRDLYLEDGVLVDTPSGDIDETVDAAGCYVAPGFIDLHTHVFTHPEYGKGRVPADRIGVRQGVAAVIDAGSSGAPTIDAFTEAVLATQATRVYAFINIGSPGLPDLDGGHASRPELCHLDAAVRAFERHGDWLVGVKVLASQSHTGSFGLEAVKLARKAAELVNRPLMLHVGNAPPLIDDVLDLLREGDIVTHTYHGKIGGVLGFEDRIIPAFRRAVERGVVVDLGHGRSSFSFRVCERAFEQGMPLHTISSDLHRGNVDRYAVSLARTMTKMRALGMSLMEVVRCVTVNPAKAVALDRLGFGVLRKGKSGTLSIFRERLRTDLSDPASLEDAEGESRIGEHYIEPIGVVVDSTYHPVSEPI